MTLPFMKPNFEKIVKDQIGKGIDCAHKSPFLLTIEIPRKEGLGKSHKTGFFPLHNLPGAKVGLKYYPVKHKHTQICVRIEDQLDREHFGVIAYANVERQEDEVGFWDFKKKDSPLDKHFHFSGNIGASNEFLRDEKNLWKGVEITVQGYVFTWDERLKTREEWRFSAGVTGFRNSWDPFDVCHYQGTIQFRTRRGDSIWANLPVLARNSPVFHRMLVSSNPAFIYFPSKYDSLYTALALCYDYRLFQEDSLEFDMKKLELLIFFNDYKVSNYKSQLEKHLEEYIDYANVGRLVKYAYIAEAHTLQRKCMEFMRMCLRTNKFFLIHSFKDIRKILSDVVEMETYHEWISN